MTKKKQTRHISKESNKKLKSTYIILPFKSSYATKIKKIQTSLGFISSSNIGIILKSFSSYFLQCKIYNYKIK